MIRFSKIDKNYDINNILLEAHAEFSIVSKHNRLWLIIIVTFITHLKILFFLPFFMLPNFGFREFEYLQVTH